MSEAYVKVLTLNTGKGFITNADQETDGLSFNILCESDGYTYVKVTGDATRIQTWSTRVSGENTTQTIVEAIIAALPPTENDRIADLQSQTAQILLALVERGIM